MNTQSNITSDRPSQRGTAPSSMFSYIGDIADTVARVRFLNEAIFMAASDRSLPVSAINAFQAVSEEIANKLLIVEDRLEELQGMVETSREKLA